MELGWAFPAILVATGPGKSGLRTGPVRCASPDPRWRSFMPAPQQRPTTARRLRGTGRRSLGLLQPLWTQTSTLLGVIALGYEATLRQNEELPVPAVGGPVRTPTSSFS